MPRKKRIKPDAIREIQASGHARWKFVVCGPEDLEEIAGLQREFGLTEIWLSPEGTTPAAVIGADADGRRRRAGARLEPDVPRARPDLGRRTWQMTAFKSINVSVIAPAAYLREFAGQDPATVHHVAAQRVLARSGVPGVLPRRGRSWARMIILDNGVFDLGEALARRRPGPRRAGGARGRRSSCPT